MKQEIRFYVCMILGYSLMMIGIWIPPVGIISNSVIIAAGIVLCIGALSIGIDVKGIIHEIRLMKEDDDRKLLNEGKELGDDREPGDRA